MGSPGDVSDLASDLQVELARRIAAAWIAVKLGVTAETAYRRYCAEQPPGEAWMNLARLTELVGRKAEQGEDAIAQAAQQASRH